MTESMREAFEKWVRTDPYFKYDDISLDYEDGCYLDCDAGRLFKAWCSSRSQPQQWIKCSDRLPTEADGDHEGDVWCFADGGVHLWNAEGAATWAVKCNITHWIPTGLKKPDPPKE